MNVKLGFFPYNAGDYKAAQAYLDREAAAGWALKRVWLGWFALFEPGEGRSHFVDLDLRKFLEDGPDPDYLTRCGDAGWELVQSLRGMLLFRAKVGERPVPIQTDAALEQERFWKRYVLKELAWSAVWLAVLFAVIAAARLMPSHSSSLVPSLSLFSAPAYLLALALGAVHVLWSGLSTAIYFLRCRRTDALAVPGRVSSRLRGGLLFAYQLLMVLALVLSLAEPAGLGVKANLSLDPLTEEATATVEACRAYPVVMGMDLGLDSADAGYRTLTQRRGPLAEFISYGEFMGSTPQGITMERYDCAFPALAQWAVERRREEFGRGAAFPYEPDWQEAPELGFDQCWISGNGEFLLLRQGKVAVRLQGLGVDLTTPENLAMIRERLGLSPA